MIPLIAFVAAAASSSAQTNLLDNGGFEHGFKSWSRWGDNASLITLETGSAHSGKNSAKLGHGHNALFFSAPLTPGTAYELRCFHRLQGRNPAGQVSLGFITKGGPLGSAGYLTLDLKPSAQPSPEGWTEFRHVFLPSPRTATCQFSFKAGEGSVLWLDDVALAAVPCPAGLVPPPDPWEGLNHRTARPLFRELLSSKPGSYSAVSWAHDLSPKTKKKGASNDLSPEELSRWSKEARRILEEAAQSGMGFLNLPGSLDGREPWRTSAFHRELFGRHGVRYDVWTEGSATLAAARQNGAELLNPSAVALGRRLSFSWVDPKYVEAQERILRQLGQQLRGEPFVGVYYGKDEPTVHLPEGPAAQWGPYGQAMAREVIAKYGFGKFAPPEPKEKAFQEDPSRPLRWIAYNRWMSDRFLETRLRLRQALHEADPKACYTGANYWFMSGFVPFDYPKLAAASDLIELDPYASSAERRRGRGVFNHSFGAKLLRDLTGKPVRIIAQTFDYAGYDMTPENLREWVSQSLRGGATAIDYYTMDSPRRTDPDRWAMMLHLAKTLTRMNQLPLPTDSDTAVLFTLYTHMSHGENTDGDQVYAAHVLAGEQAGSWHTFVADSQLERGEKSLAGFKTVYLPLARYLTAEATARIEEYVQQGGTLICGDADAFAADLEGKDTTAARARILGLRTTGPKQADHIRLRQAAWGQARGAKLPLFPMKLWDQTSPGQARSIEVADPQAEVLGEYPDGTPAMVSRRLGQGRVITFAANPFAPQVAVDASPWPALIKGLQQEAGCVVDRPIWRFALPEPKPAKRR